MPAQPNLILIIADQMRGDCLGADGHPLVQTPQLDRLAARGTRFTADYSSCPSCIAARASLFTGLRPTSHGRLGYQDQIPWRYTHTLAEELAGGGYQTHCVGKTHSYDNLATDPHRQDLLKFWRQRMIEELAPRTQDGLSNGKRLIPGICLPHVRPALLQPTEES